jgi:hypothetical protein
VVTDWIEQNLEGGKVTHVGFIGSSSWSSAYTYDTDLGAKYFVKTALGKDEGMFKGEALGLQAMYGVQHPPHISRHDAQLLGICKMEGNYLNVS